VSFYYGSGEPPPHKERFAGLKEFWAVCIAVFSVLAWPVGLILGGILWLVITVMLFGVHWSLGLLSIALLVAAIGAFAYWDRHRSPNVSA
jgi:hypothetical protein